MLPSSVDIQVSVMGVLRDIRTGFEKEDIQLPLLGVSRDMNTAVLYKKVVYELRFYGISHRDITLYNSMDAEIRRSSPGETYTIAAAGVSGGDTLYLEIHAVTRMQPLWPPPAKKTYSLQRLMLSWAVVAAFVTWSVAGYFAQKQL